MMRHGAHAPSRVRTPALQRSCRNLQNDRVPQRRQILHAIEIDVAVGVLDLMLKHPCCEVFDLDVQRIAVVIDTAETKVLVAGEEREGGQGGKEGPGWEGRWRESE